MSESKSMPPVMLLHGWGFASAVMQPLARALTGRFDVKTPNVPGLTAAGPECTSLDAISAALQDNLTQRTILVGWSLGGNVAVEIALRAPERVSSLVLVCTTPSLLVRPHWSCGLDAGALVGLQSQVKENVAAALAEFAGWCAMGERSVKSARQTLLDAMNNADTNARSLALGLKILQRLDQREALSRLDCPILMLFAANDYIVPVDCAQACQGLSTTAEIEMIKDCGHALPVSLPGTVAGRIGSLVQP